MNQAQVKRAHNGAGGVMQKKEKKGGAFSTCKQSALFSAPIPSHPF